MLSFQLAPNWLAVVTLNPPIDSMYPPASRDLHFTANKCSKSFVTTLIYSVTINLSVEIYTLTCFIASCSYITSHSSSRIQSSSRERSSILTAFFMQKFPVFFKKVLIILNRSNLRHFYSSLE